MTRTFYQSHTCDGFRAKITIEWDIPKDIDETTIRNRLFGAEDIADAILAFAGPRMIHMVQTMRGYSVTRPASNSEAK